MIEIHLRMNILEIKKKELDIAVPKNYFKNDNPNLEPLNIHGEDLQV